MNQPAGEWEQAQYWQQHTDLLGEGDTDEAATEEPPTARRPGRPWLRTLTRVAIATVAVTALVATVGPGRRSTPSANGPTADPVGVPV